MQAEPTCGHRLVRFSSRQGTQQKPTIFHLIHNLSCCPATISFPPVSFAFLIPFLSFLVFFFVFFFLFVVVLSPFWVFRLGRWGSGAAAAAATKPLSTKESQSADRIESNRPSVGPQKDTNERR